MKLGKSATKEILKSVKGNFSKYPARSRRKRELKLRRSHRFRMSSLLDMSVVDRLTTELLFHPINFLVQLKFRKRENRSITMVSGLNCICDDKERLGDRSAVDALPSAIRNGGSSVIRNRPSTSVPQRKPALMQKTLKMAMNRSRR